MEVSMSDGNKYDSQAAEDEDAAGLAVAGAIRAIAAREDSLARAASEDYPVGDAVLDLLAERLADDVRAMCSSGAHARVTKRAFDTEQDDAHAPGAVEFRLLDAVAAAVRRANETLPTAVGKWVCSRVLELDLQADDPDANPDLAPMVLATLRTEPAARPSGRSRAYVREVEFTTFARTSNGRRP
jgi:hypothetical protein